MWMCGSHSSICHFLSSGVVISVGALVFCTLINDSDDESDSDIGDDVHDDAAHAGDEGDGDDADDGDD